MADEMVLKTQKWLNVTYGNDSRYNIITENGNTGWSTVYALRRALQIELGITSTSNSFGPTTTAKFKERFPNGVQQQVDEDETESNVYAIIQGALWCKGYGTGTYAITKHFYGGTASAIKKLKNDAGCANADSANVTLNLMKALLSMDYFVCSSYNNGDEKMKVMQQYLNRNYEEYIGIGPCDGLYGRSTNTALIYAIQAEEGLGTSTANGNFGPSTKKYCPTIPYDNVATNAQGEHYNAEQINRFIKLLQIALYANGFGNGTLSDTYDAEIVTEFQHSYALSIYNGVCSLETWLSLLISCGDTSRSSKACDCATILTEEKAKTLYDNGYRRVGRYLTGKIASGTSKAITKEELKVIFDAKLYPFIIYQESANKVTYFTTSRAKIDIDKAIEKAEDLFIPRGTTIYFAVDCDPQESEITSYIIPYFQTINEEMKNTYNNKYIVGIYGTRNVCTKVSEKKYIEYSFVSDMSTGFSGNLGFKIPDNWSFDQFTTTTIGTEDGKIEIDKDAMSNRDLGIIDDLFLSDVGQVYYSILDMYNLAMQYTNNDNKKSNRLVLEYIRKNRYGDTTLFGGGLSNFDNNIEWKIVAGKIDEDYCNLVASKLKKLKFDFKDGATNKEHDLPHWAATLNAILWPVADEKYEAYDQIIDVYAGWGGDTISFAKNIKEAVVADNSIDYQKWAKENIASDKENRFNIVDYIDDIDAVNIGYLIQYRNYNLPEAFKYYYAIKDGMYDYPYKTRTSRFINDTGTETINGLCDRINSEALPMSLFKKLLAGITVEQKYIDAAISAFKSKIENERKKEIQDNCN